VFLRQGEERSVAYGVCGCLYDVYLLLVHNLHLTCLPCEVSYGCEVYLCLGHYLGLPAGLSDLANDPRVAMIRIY
jgi:hypothetical protein